MALEPEPITVVLAADSFLIGDGLASLLASVPDITVVGRTNDHTDLVELVDELEPEVVIISIRTPIITTMATIDLARRLHENHEQMGFVVIADRGNGFALELLRGGAARIAFLLDERLPSIDTVVSAVHEVRDGNTVLDATIVDSLVRRRDHLVVDDLSLRELDVLEQIAHGLNNRAVAAELHISIKAVEKHVTTIFRKLGLTDAARLDRRVTAALIYLRAMTNPAAAPDPDPTPHQRPDG